MDLTQLANLGEFIGGVAVLVTLGYLAIQVRHNSRLLDVQNLQVSAAGHQRIYTALLDMKDDSSDGLTRVFFENATELPPADAGRAEAYFNSFLIVIQCDFLIGRRGDSYDEYWSTSAQTLDYLAAAPFFRIWWDSVGRTQYTESFAALVDKAIAGSRGDKSYAVRGQAMLGGGKADSSP